MRLKDMFDQISTICTDHIELNTRTVLNYLEILAVEDIEILAIVNQTATEI
jgi:hypothetical protein